MTVGFHRNPVETGYLLIDEDDDFSWEWHPFDLPQLIRNTVSDPKDMIPTDFHHTIYELEGDLKELSSVQNSELLDKRLIRKNVTSKLTLTKSTTLLEELIQYFDRVLELPPETIEKVLKAFNDHSRNIGME